MSVAVRVRKAWLIGGAALLVALAGLLGLAWQDAGQEPLRLIAEPVSLPEVRP
jgi:hypothetical protein